MENELVIKTQEDVVNLANNYIKQNNIVVGKDYNVTNAMVAMYTNVLTVKDKQGKSVLDTCTPASIQNAIYQCITNKLTPDKKQAYFIPYGSELTCQLSYFGNAKRARDVAGVVINSMVVRDGDQIDMEMRVNGTMLIRHKPNIASLNKPVIAAYAVACNEVTGEVVNSDIMSIEEIKKSWAKSRTGGAVSKEFPHEMARRTVTNRLAKHIVNTSDDSQDVYITDIDGKRIKINKYDDLPQEEEFDYTIDAVGEETYKPQNETENVVTASDLQLDDAPSVQDTPSADIPEDAFEIKYSEYKNNQDKYNIVKNSYNASKHTCMVTNK